MVFLFGSVVDIECFIYIDQVFSIICVCVQFQVGIVFYQFQFVFDGQVVVYDEVLSGIQAFFVNYEFRNVDWLEVINDSWGIYCWNNIVEVVDFFNVIIVVQDNL